MFKKLKFTDKKTLMKAKLILTTLFFFSCIICFAQTTEIKKVQFPEHYQSKIDEVYTTVKDWNGRIDLYFNPDPVNMATIGSLSLSICSNKTGQTTAEVGST